MTSKTRRIELEIDGMTCSGCEAQVASRFEAVEGVLDTEVRHSTGTAAVVTADGVREETLLGALDGTPYTARRWTPDEAATGTGSPGQHVAVIGGGSAGFAAAIRAVELGARVSMIQHGTLGGTCVNVGCVPSKTLIRAAEAHHKRAHHPFDGVPDSGGPVDWSRIRESKDQLVAALRKAKYEDVLAAYPEIALIEGWGLLDAEGTVHLTGGTKVAADRVVIATGSSPRIPDVPGLPEAGYLDSTALLDIEALPASLAVLGAGSVGLELAQAYARLGVGVTVIARSRLLSKGDPDVGMALTRHLRDEGIQVLVDTTVHSVERTRAGRRLHLATTGEADRVLDVGEVLVAAGRRPNTDGMGLDVAGIAVGDRGEIVVDDSLCTSNSNVFAVGDVTGEPMHVYVAAQAGYFAAENALGGNQRLDLSVVPQVTFTDPGVATVGLTEAEARAAGMEPMVSRLSMEHVPRALAARDTRGFVKLVADAASRRIVGAHIVAPEAGEMIMEPALAVRFGLTIDDLTSTLHPYLTLSEAVKLAALTFEKDVAKLSCCAV